jgi:hypothetical protein
MPRRRQPVTENLGFGSAMPSPGCALSSGKYVLADLPNQPDHKSGDKKPKNEGDAGMLPTVFCAPKPNAESGNKSGQDIVNPIKSVPRTCKHIGPLCSAWRFPKTPTIPRYHSFPNAARSPCGHFVFSPQPLIGTNEFAHVAINATERAIRKGGPDIAVLCQ